jgi:hypothetical protein
MTTEQIRVNGFNLFFIQGGIQEMRHIVLVAITPYQVNLVFHEGDQGTDDNGHAFAHHSGQLVTKGFASARGHDHKSIFATEHCFNDRTLVLFKAVKAKIFLQVPE